MSVYRTIGPLVTICKVESGVTFVQRCFRDVLTEKQEVLYYQDGGNKGTDQQANLHQFLCLNAF